LQRNPTLLSAFQINIHILLSGVLSSVSSEDGQ